ncbi:MAG: holo-ACP synthase [Treponema sp.]|jgi:holo-[acyl-carrier protein] synthase|nr:holo-ACP synthase [Treponema sp.]
MITGTGCDIAKISRFERWVHNKALTRRFFHPEELGILDRSPRQAAQSLAARFAAKEAYSKALGTGFHGLELRDICVVTGGNGKPSLAVHKSALGLLQKNGADTIHLSLSHDGDYALAFVILEKTELEEKNDEIL